MKNAPYYFLQQARILDGDKAELVPVLKAKFPNYHFMHIAADDIRTKKARKASDAVDGLLDAQRELKEEYKEPTKHLFHELNAYMEERF